MSNMIVPILKISGYHKMFKMILKVEKSKSKRSSYFHNNVFYISNKAFLCIFCYCMVQVSWTKVNTFLSALPSSHSEDSPSSLSLLLSTMLLAIPSQTPRNRKAKTSNSNKVLQLFLQSFDLFGNATYKFHTYSKQWLHTIQCMSFNELTLYLICNLITCIMQAHALRAHSKVLLKWGLK